MHARLLDVLHDPADDARRRCGRAARRRRPRSRLRGTGRRARAARPRGRLRGRASRSCASSPIARRRSVVVVHDLHRAPAEHVRRAHEHRVADVARDRDAPSSTSVAVPPAGCGMPSRSHSALNCSRSSAASIDAGDGPEDRDARRFERVRELQRRLAAERHDDARELRRRGRGALQARRQTFSTSSIGERLEEQPVARVVVGRHRLRVAVDHHRLEAGVPQRERGVHTAVVELDALADPVRAAAEDHRPPSRVSGASSSSSSYVP